MSRLGIIAALPAEANCLHKNNLTIASPVEIEKDIFLCLSGIGHEAAWRSTLKLIDLNVDAFISWGIAGAIDKNMKSGELILADRLITGTSEHVISVAWLDRLSEHFRHTSISFKTGAIFSSSEICASNSDKSKLFEISGALAIDMESAAIAELANREKKDFLILRTVADEANDSIPEAVLHHTDNLGRPVLLPFLCSCIKKPAQIPVLYRLGSCFKSALHTLEQNAINLKKQQFLYNKQ